MAQMGGSSALSGGLVSDKGPFVPDLNMPGVRSLMELYKGAGTKAIARALDSGCFMSPASAAA